MADLTTTTQVQSGVNTFYVRTMLKAARPLLVHTRWAQVKDIPRNNSLNIRWRRYSLLTAATTPLSEGVTPTGSQLSVTNVNATIAQYGDFITLTDVLTFSTLDPVLTETKELQGQQAGNTLDQLTRDIIIAGNTVQHASTATDRSEVTLAMKLTRTEIRIAVKTLQNNNAEVMLTMINPSTGFNTSPIDASYIGIISPDTLFDLKDETGFIPVAEYPNQKGVMDGEVGSMDSVRFVMTTNAKTFASTVTVQGTIIMAKNFYANTRISGEAMKTIDKPAGAGEDPLNQRQTAGWKVTFVAKILNDNFAVRIEHGASA